MRSLLICVTAALYYLASAPPLLACAQSHGNSATDTQVARRICDTVTSPRLNKHILMMSVNESILYVDISRQFYNEMLLDRAGTKSLVKQWMRLMRKETSKQAVTVWIYVNKAKVIKGETRWTGEDKVSFL